MNRFLERIHDFGDRIVGVAMKGGSGAQGAFKSVAKRGKLAARGMDADDHKKASAYLERGRQYYNQKRYERAADYFLKAAALDDRYSLAHYYVGCASYKLEDTDAAVRAWKRVIELDPESEIATKSDRRIAAVKGKMSRIIEKLEGV